MHQNKPTAPIEYLNHKGKKVIVNDQETQETSLSLELKELAILQTCLNRSYFNCNCNLNKEVLGKILAKVKANLKTYGSNDD